MKKAIMLLVAVSLLGLARLAAADKWTGLSKYESQNAALVAARNMGNRVVMMGNSITALWLAVDPGFFAAHSNIINRGISGQTTYQMLVRFRSDVVNLQPKVVVILGGTNDIAENFGLVYNENRTLGNIVTMVELARLHKIKPIVCAVPPSASYFWSKTATGIQLKILRLNERLAAYCKQQGIVFVDYYTPLVKGADNALNPDYTKDGVHPNLAGYKVMEPILLKAVSRYVK